jgi:hypothetical protein
MEILDLPDGVDLTAVSLTMRDSVAKMSSPYTGGVARLEFGGRWWEMMIETAPLSPRVASDLDGWGDRLIEPGVVARLARPALIGFHGTAGASSISISTAAPAGAVSLSVQGVGAGLTVLRGSIVAIGGRLHRVQALLVGGSGDPLRIKPSLRAAVSIGDAVETGNAAAGLWVMIARPPRSHARDFGNYAPPMAFQFAEAVG